MGETIDQIKSEIDTAQQDLSTNLNELERKVKSVVDWKQQFQANPMLMLGFALGGGVALAALTGGGQNRRRGESGFPGSARTSEPRAAGNSKAAETWDNVGSALIGVAAARFTELIDRLVPGFQDQFRRAADKPKANQNIQ